MHFHSKRDWSDLSQALECVNFANDIKKVEEKTGCSDSILIGDFNMNPFEVGMVGANGLIALQDLDYGYTNPKGREIDGSHYKYFYNPMWNSLGDHKWPAGTYYYRVPGHISYEWHLFDQVIVRPSFKPFLSNNSVKIVTKIGNRSLIGGADNRPLQDDFSDHLPIYINLNI